MHEFCETRQFFAKIIECSRTQCLDSASKRWHHYFKLRKDSGISAVPRNIFQVVSAALSIPGSNAFPERTFSLMNAKWREDGNRASVRLIKAELQIYLYFEMKCSECTSLLWAIVNFSQPLRAAKNIPGGVRIMLPLLLMLPAHK